MTVDELLSRISSRELSEWMAYAEIEPFGARMDHLMAAQIASAIYNVNRDPKKSKPVTPEDLMPQTKREEQMETPQSLFAKFKAWALSMGAKKQ